MGHTVLLFGLVVLCLCFFTTSATENTHAKSSDETAASLRNRRSDDSNPVEVVVNQHSQDLAQLQAELLALKARTTQLERAVGFTVRFSQSDISGLGFRQPVVFDTVEFNAGGGYDKNTGIFTVPASGTYVLALSLQRHSSDEDTFKMGIMKGGVILAVAEAGYSPYEHGTMVVTTHLNQGDTISVQTLHGTTVYGSHSTAFTGFRISPS